MKTVHILIVSLVIAVALGSVIAYFAYNYFTGEKKQTAPAIAPPQQQPAQPAAPAQAAAPVAKEQKDSLLTEDPSKRKSKTPDSPKIGIDAQAFIQKMKPRDIEQSLKKYDENGAMKIVESYVKKLIPLKELRNKSFDEIIKHFENINILAQTCVYLFSLAPNHYDPGTINLPPKNDFDEYHDGVEYVIKHSQFGSGRRGTTAEELTSEAFESTAGDKQVDAFLKAVGSYGDKVEIKLAERYKRFRIVVFSLAHIKFLNEVVGKGKEDCMKHLVTAAIIAEEGRNNLTE